MTGQKQTTGFVPTMGALHAGHISLIKKAKAENQVVICSIFVNPTQFNDPKDLLRYPRTPEEDQKMLSEAGCDVLFLPSESEIYPGSVLPDFEFGMLDKVMEGKFRPGHFKGVAAVVYRLFGLIGPTRAYFGEKDFQQLAIIREMVRLKKLSVIVVGCETLREPGGLALSSRNVLLTPKERDNAGIIYHSLVWAVKQLKNRSPEQVRKETKERIENVPGFNVQYLEFVDSETLQPITGYDPARPQRACIAVITTTTRLIDNIAL